MTEGFTTQTAASNDCNCPRCGLPYLSIPRMGISHACPADKIRPLRDRVVVRRMEYKHPVLAVIGIVLSKGTVVAVGPGRRMRRKTRFDKVKGQESGSIWFEDGDETGQIRPMRVNVGDVVEFVPRTTGRTADTEFEIDGVKFLLIREQSIFGKTTDSQHEAQLEVRAVGRDKAGNVIVDV